MTRPPIASGPGRYVLGRVLAGALLGALLAVVVGYALDGIAAAGLAVRPSAAYRGFLADGGWAWLPLWGAAAGMLLARRAAATRTARLLLTFVPLAMALAPLAWRPALPDRPEALAPADRESKIRSIRKWSYRSPATVARILPYTRDADSVVRTQAVLALGVNLIVTDSERISEGFPSRYHDHPVRDSLRARLHVSLRDADEGIRAEAARALWNAPRAFGPQPDAAETLAAILQRAADQGATGRRVWLALDAAAGTRDGDLRAAAARFAESTGDTSLARIARAALDRTR